MKHALLLTGSILAGLFTAAGSAQAQANLVQDSSFESATKGVQIASGSLGDGWSASPLAYVNEQSAYAHTGSRYAVLGNLGGSGVAAGGISQTISTVAGKDYLLSFWADASSTVNSFSVVFGNGAVTGIPAILPNTGAGTASAWVNYSATVRATGASSVLGFFATDATGYTRIDDVSLIATGTGAVPEPATWAMTMLGIGAVGAALRRRSARTTMRVAFA